MGALMTFQIPIYRVLFRARTPLRGDAGSSRFPKAARIHIGRTLVLCFALTCASLTVGCLFIEFDYSIDPAKPLTAHSLVSALALTLAAPTAFFAGLRFARSRDQVEAAEYELWRLRTQKCVRERQNQFFERSAELEGVPAAGLKPWDFKYVPME